ncbi:MAG: hypothetical protein AKCLJLPJ_01953 [Fimbriimonadales bacterium]|nr:hypothetical protein [Fimbriimonadales bacterium]
MTSQENTVQIGSNVDPAVTDEELELESIQSEKDDEEGGLATYEMQSYPADFTLEVLETKFKNGDIRIPDIQRKYVWSLPQASRLIESFLLGLPVPSIFLYEEKGTGQLLVVDGQQRMRSVVYFLRESFGEEKKGKTTVFRLKLSAKSPWNGKKYSDLAEDDQRRLRNSVLRAFIMRQLNPEDQTSIQHVFERLNTGGTQLTPQEVRNCIYDGPFNRCLHELNVDESWRLVLGKKAPDRRQKDVELILRFLALRFGQPYTEPMKEYLGKFMAKERKGGRNEEFKREFLDTITSVLEALGEKPFHIKAGLNVAVFDSVALAFAKHKGQIGPQIRSRFEALTKRGDYSVLISQATTSVRNVTDRMKLAEHVIFETE